MNRSHLQVWVLTGISLSAWLCVQPIAAQVVPDNTLPVRERSQVSGNPTVQIDGGAVRGGNLFHSFSQLSIPTGGSAYFNNAIAITNIFARITGNSISNIDGVLRANGAANLFLLNPNGILFGPNASLNIGGSFVATTADSVNFADRFQYSATNPQTAPLLTVSVPVGLQMGTNPGAIEVRGNGYNLSVSTPFFSPLIRGSNSIGLQVSVGRTLALVGGDIKLMGGTLTAEQGRIELGSVRSGQVSLGSDFALSYPAVQTSGDIRLSQQALVDARGGSVIQVQGHDVSLTDGSLFFIQNQGLQSGGQIRVNAARSLEVSGTDSKGRIASGLSSEAIDTGAGANLLISTQQLLVQNGARIIATSYRSGTAGNVTVSASDLLTIRNGGTIGSITYGEGSGGDVTISATNSVTLIGVGAVNFLPSILTAVTFGRGNAGNLIVNTSRLTLQDGGVVSGSTLASGNAANVTVNATEFVELSGIVPLGAETPSFIGAAAPLVSGSLQRISRLPLKPSGNSGNVVINTGRLSITDSARVNVRNLGTGEAGTLQINAGSVFLDKEGSITATTASGQGGNLILQVQNLLLLRNASQISATAFGNGNGGNIKIDASSIVAIPTENSDISANSVNARGGNVTINTSGIFGIQFRPQETPLSDITATGANSALNGTVQLNINQLDPTSGLVALPTTVVDSSRLIAQGCPANQGNSFVITGRGGLPPTPEQQLDDDANWQDRRRLVVAQQADSGKDRKKKAEGRIDTQPHSSIVEATGWQLTPTGEIFLVATSPVPTVQHRLNQAIACQGRG
jgi:filamentous hemagglutinin family protein